MWKTAILLVAGLALGACTKVGDGMQSWAEASSPGLKARGDYERSVVAYKACLVDHPAKDCEGPRALMDASARVLASMNQSSGPSTVYVQTPIR